MQTKSAELQDQINELDQSIQNGASDAQLNLWEMQRDELRLQKQAALAEEEQTQVANESAGFIFDTLEVDGLTAPEIITDDAQYNLIRKGVQNLVVTLTSEHFKTVSELQSEHKQETEMLREFISCETLRADQMKDDNKDLEVANYQLELENAELSEKVTKIAALQYESDQQIAQQKQHIEDLQNQIAIGVRGALNVVNIPQDTSKFVAEINASKPRITSVRFKDENGIDTRTKRAENILTGETFDYEAIYEKRYIILNATEAEQYRADEANKKAEAELQLQIIPTLETPEIQPVNDVTETVEATQENTFQEEIQAINNGEVQADQGNEPVYEVVGEAKSQVSREEFETLSARVSRIEAYANLPIAV